MKSIFRYAGGKAKKSVKERIFSRQPDYKSYRESFVGGGGIFFEIDSSIPRWINDINYGLISVYKALRDDENFIPSCKAILPHQKFEEELPPIYNKRLKEVFNKLVIEKDANPALSYFFINRTVWGGRVNYKIPSRLYFSNPTGWNIINTNLLEEAANLLKNVKITNTDYKEVIMQEGESVWIYCDPPYYKQTGTVKTSQLYEDCFTEKQHYELYEIIKNSKHKILISYDDADFIRTLYKNFNIYKENWTYCGTSNKKKNVGKELIITNY